MQSLTALAVVLLVAAALTPTESAFIDTIKICKANDPNLNQCVVSSANELIPILTQGCEEFNIPVLDPWFLPSLELVEETEYVSLDLKYMNVNQVGLKQMVIEEANIDLNAGVWNIRLKQPVFSITGHYKSKGTILKVGVDGEGEFNSTHYNTIAECTITVSKEDRGGTEYFKLEKFDLKYTFGTAQMEYTNLFNGDVEMGKTTNDFLNEHSHEILTDLKPALEKTYGDLFSVHIKAFLDHIPVKVAFPDS